MKVGVLGGGAWGTVLAALASTRGHDVALWEFDPRDAAALSHVRACARTVPDFRLPDAVAVTADIPATVRGRALVVVVVPSDTVRATLVAARAAIEPDAVVVCASKGLEPTSRLTMAGVFADVLPSARVALLSGPSFAQEIAAGLPAALVSASSDPRANETVVAALGSERFRIYTSDDVPGVAVGGALKNVIAIAVGCATASASG